VTFIPVVALLEQATVDVLKEQADPQKAAEEAVESLGLTY
jgi:hypothetical protein